jgi:hypothetical protein
MAKALMGIDDDTVGFVFDGNDDGLAPPVGNVELTQNGIIRLTIPYIHPNVDDECSAVNGAVRDWALSLGREGVKSVFLHGVGQRITLTNLQEWTDRTDEEVGAVIVRAGAAIFAKPTEIVDDYRVKEFASTIDGLREFANFRGFCEEGMRSRPEGRVSITPVENECVAWKSGGLQYRIERCDRWSLQVGESIHFDFDVMLKTRAAEGSSLFEHFRAHTKVRALLTLLFGKRLAWRSHSVTDEMFPKRFVNGHTAPPGPVPVLLAHTMTEHAEPYAELNSRQVLLSDLKKESLELWCDKYDNDEVFHAVAPAVEAIANESVFMEPTLIMLAGACERLGCLHTKEGHDPVACQFYACAKSAHLDALKLPLGIKQLSAFLARVYNRLKHPGKEDRLIHPAQREGYPDRMEVLVARDALKLLARSQALTLMNVDSDLLSRFIRSEGNALRQRIEREGFQLRKEKISDKINKRFSEIEDQLSPKRGNSSTER